MRLDLLRLVLPWCKYFYITAHIAWCYVGNIFRLDTALQIDVVFKALRCQFSSKTSLALIALLGSSLINSASTAATFGCQFFFTDLQSCKLLYFGFNATSIGWSFLLPQDTRAAKPKEIILFSWCSDCLFKVYQLILKMRFWLHSHRTGPENNCLLRSLQFCIGLQQFKNLDPRPASYFLRVASNTDWARVILRCCTSKRLVRHCSVIFEQHPVRGRSCVWSCWGLLSTLLRLSLACSTLRFALETIKEGCIDVDAHKAGRIKPGIGRIKFGISLTISLVLKNAAAEIGMYAILNVSDPTPAICVLYWARLPHCADYNQNYCSVLRTVPAGLCHPTHWWVQWNPSKLRWFDFKKL